MDSRAYAGPPSFNPYMLFFANLSVNLHVCLCGDLQVASAQTLDFLDIGQKSSFPDWRLSSTGKSFPDGDLLAWLPRSVIRIEHPRPSAKKENLSIPHLQTWNGEALL